MKKRVFAVSLALLMLALLFAGCGSAHSNGSSAADAGYYVSESSTESYDAYYEDDYYDDGDYEEAAAEEASGSGGLAVAGSGAERLSSMLSSDKIIYSANAEVETLEFDKSLEGIYAMLDSYGGFLESSTITNSDYRGYGSRTAEFVLRIPRENFRAMMGRLSELGNVPYCNTNSENITSQYTDTSARLKALEVEEERLLSMLEQADTVEDMLDIEDRLTDVRYRIEALTSTLRDWDSLINYSTIELSVVEVEDYTEVVPVQRSFGEKLGDALNGSLKSMGVFFQNFLLGLVGALPALLILAVIALVVWLIVRRILRRRAAKRAASVVYAAPPVPSEPQVPPQAPAQPVDPRQPPAPPEQK